MFVQPLNPVEKYDGLPLSGYECVEVALLDNSYHLLRPEHILSEDLCVLFESYENPVAGYVSWENVERMREQLRHG